MEKEVTETAVGMIDKWADKFGDAINQYGPQATELALAVGRLSAAKEIALAILGVLVGLVAGWFITKKASGVFWAEWKNPTGYKWSDGSRDMAPGISVPFGIITIVSGIGSLGFVWFSVRTLVDPFLWIGLSRPEVYLAAKALNL